MTRRPSAATTLALLALFMSVGGGDALGGAAKKLIDGKTIKRGTIEANRLTPKARNVLKGKPGPAGPVGPSGPAGSNAGIDGVAAGGVLTGTYPSPGLAADAVRSDQVKDGSLNKRDVVSASGHRNVLALFGIEANTCATETVNPDGIGDISEAIIVVTPHHIDGNNKMILRAVHASNDQEFDVIACNFAAESKVFNSFDWAVIGD